MSVEYVALSFFKTNNIDYYYKKPVIYFPCPVCSSESGMNINDGTWKCKKCNERGTLVTLIEEIEGNRSSSQAKLMETKIYNPTLEKRRLNQRFQYLTDKYGIDIKLLKNEVDELINYYKKQLEKIG